MMGIGVLSDQNGKVGQNVFKGKIGFMGRKIALEKSSSRKPFSDSALRKAVFKSGSQKTFFGKGSQNLVFRNLFEKPFSRSRFLRMCFSTCVSKGFFACFYASFGAKSQSGDLIC